MCVCVCVCVLRISKVELYMCVCSYRCVHMYVCLTRQPLSSTAMGSRWMTGDDGATGGDIGPALATLLPSDINSKFDSVMQIFWLV